jgi:hypothetical protein
MGELLADAVDVVWWGAVQGCKLPRARGELRTWSSERAWTCDMSGGVREAYRGWKRVVRWCSAALMGDVDGKLGRLTFKPRARSRCDDAPRNNPLLERV